MKQSKQVVGGSAGRGSGSAYTLRVLGSPQEVPAADWNALLAAQGTGGLNPFMRHEYLAALHDSGSAVPGTGWTPRFLTLWQGEGDTAVLAAACALYLKTHSYGEYVFDWAWANAYEQHGLAYYPKALVAAPFTPVPGPRLLARNAAERALLAQALLAWCDQEKLSSLHVLFATDEDVAACETAGLMLRHTVQFHWTNRAPTLVAARTALPPEGAHFASGRPGGETSAPTLVASRTALPPEGALSASGRPVGETSAPTLVASRTALPPEGALSASGRPGGETSAPTLVAPDTAQAGDTAPTRFQDFDHFLASLNQEKRKKIRQERRKVADAGIAFRWARGRDIGDADWDFFYRCYERTYYEHGNAPYLTRDFFRRMQATMPDNWLMFIAEHTGGGTVQPVAASLVAVTETGGGEQVAYGRYWGALARVDSLHFEACYYQPLQWCIDHGIDRFEGGAQGEHKMARALLPVRTTSAHWLAHPSFADAVERFLQREGEGIGQYMESLEQRTPYRQAVSGRLPEANAGQAADQGPDDDDAATARPDAP